MKSCLDAMTFELRSVFSSDTESLRASGLRQVLHKNELCGAPHERQKSKPDQGIRAGGLVSNTWAPRRYFKYNIDVFALEPRAPGKQAKVRGIA